MLLNVRVESPAVHSEETQPAQRAILTHVYMASVEELDQIDSGMGSSDARSPEVKSLLPEEDEDDEEVWMIVP